MQGQLLLTPDSGQGTHSQKRQHTEIPELVHFASSGLIKEADGNKLFFHQLIN